MNIDLSILFEDYNFFFCLLGLGLAMLLSYVFMDQILNPFKRQATCQVYRWIVQQGGTKEEQLLLKNAWDKISEFRLKGGVVIGNIEKVIFYFGLFLGSELLIGGWLTFKIASKWESWSNIVKVPSKPEDEVHHIDFVFRRYWGTLVMQRFVVGTGMNLLFAGAGVLVTYILKTWFLGIL